MKRRTVLVAVGALAGGGASVAAVSADESGKTEPDCDSTAEIVTAKSGDEPIATQQVPEPWYDQVERARDVQDELGDEFGDEVWFEGTGRSASNEEICGMSRMTVTVYASDEEAAGQQVPESRDGVRIRVEESMELAPDGPTLDGDELPDEAKVDLDGDVTDGTEDAADSDANATDGTNGNATDDNASDGTSGSASDGNQASGDADGTPGPGVLGALAGLGGVGYLLASRRDTEDRS